MFFICWCLFPFWSFFCSGANGWCVSFKERKKERKRISYYIAWMLTLKMLPSTTAVFSMFIYVSFYFLYHSSHPAHMVMGVLEPHPVALGWRQRYTLDLTITRSLTERQTVGNDGEDKRTFNLENLLWIKVKEVVKYLFEFFQTAWLMRRI